MKKEVALLDRFWANVMPEPMSGCWLWIGGWNGHGYGSLSVDGRVLGAHVVAYVLFIGPLPEGTEPDHLCRVRCCVNPEHLEAVSHRVNLLRSPFHARRAAATTCRQGHPYDVTVLVRGRWIARRCRRCHAATERRRHARLRGDRPLRVLKLSADQVREIRRRYQPGQRGHGCLALAKEFGVSNVAIHKIISGRIRKALADERALEEAS